MKVAIIPIVIGAFSTVTEGLVQGLEDWEIRGLEETMETKIETKIGQNTEKSPGNLRTLIITLTSMRNH